VYVSRAIFFLTSTALPGMKTEVTQEITTELLLKGGLQSLSVRFFPALYVKPQNETCITTFQKRNKVLST